MILYMTKRPLLYITGIDSEMLYIHKILIRPFAHAVIPKSLPT